MDDMEVHSQSPPASVASSFLIHLSLAPSLSQEVLMVINTHDHDGNNW